MRRFAVLIIFLISFAAPAQENIIPLTRVIDSYLTQDTEYNLVKQDRDAAVEKIDEALDTFVPSLRASATMSSADKSRDDFKDIPLYKVPSAKVRLSQVLFSDSKLAAMSTNENRAKAQRLVAEVLRTDMIADAAKRYCNVLRYRALLKAYADADRQYAAAAAKFKIKQRYSLDPSAEKQSLEAVLTDLALVTGIHDIANYSFLPYASVFASPLNTELALLFTTEGINPETLISKFSEKALASSPQLLALDEFIKINRRDILSAQRKFSVPDVSVTGEYTRYFEGDQTDPEFFKTLDENQWNMSLKLTIPLFDGTKKQNELSEKQSELLTYFNRKAQVKELVKENVAQAVDKAMLAGRDYSLKKDALKKSEEKFQELSKLRKYSESKTLITQHFTARQRFIESEYTFMTSLLDVQRIYGKFFFYNEDESDKRFMDDMLNGLQISR
ncbi:TolC family protein [Seleniivibrio woodruffii]|uniref:TolC family protein n=1 Tax=Seleniivibrio woodruffii TaxID=1078050 RepID=UPI0026F1EF46|nr:TolC family protein [Seleniivibrio woodruffii]